MTTTVRAVYKNGVLHPDRPLSLAEGAAVELTVGPVEGDDELTRRLRDAKTFEEWLEVTKMLPSDDGGYDIVAALNENRICSGERPLIPSDGPRP